MEVRVLVYLERADEGWVWWAEAPDVPGFSAADDSLQTLLIRSELALRDILAEERAEDVAIRHELVGTPPASEGVRVKEESSERTVGERFESVIPAA